MPYKDPEKQKEAQHASYQRNKERILAKTTLAKEKKRLLIISHKSKPCADCKIEYPYYVMQFDHINDDKQFMIGAAWYNHSTAAILAEIAKCEVVCANCHMIRTWNRLQKRN